jgi:phage terminase small subunit
MKGAFDKDPQRRRADAEGSGEFDPEPPAHLPQDAVRAWRYLVDRLPKVALYSADELPVEVCSKLLTIWWVNPGDLKTLAELRNWVAKLGFSPVDRTKLANDNNRKTPNKFSRPQDPE